MEIRSRLESVANREKWAARGASFVAKAKATKVVWFPPQPVEAGKKGASKAKEATNSTARKTSSSAKRSTQGAAKKTGASKKAGNAAKRTSGAKKKTGASSAK